MATLLAQHNVPLAVADHLSPMIQDVFDGEVAKGYSCARTKTTAILNRAVAPAFKAQLVTTMQQKPFSIMIDGSSDTGLEKMNPITVRIFDIGRDKVDTRFLDMCTTSGVAAATAETIWNKMDQVLSSCDVPWINCVGVGVDNTSVNLGKHNSIKSRVQQVNNSIYFMGCPCHLAHNTACAAADSFNRTTAFDIEEMAVDLYYWFDKSSKRKNVLQDYCCFNDVTYRQVIKHVSTRWLSLETAVERTLKVYEGLRSYFLSENESQARFKRLKELFSSPMTEIYLLFFQSVLPTFTHFNMFLQREDPCIHLVYGQCVSLLQKLLGKFVKIRAMKAASHPTEVDYQEKNNQLPDSNVFIGFTTKTKLQKLEREGDVAPSDVEKFMRGVRQYYMSAVKHIREKYPFGDEVLKHSKFVDFDNRENVEYTDVEYFVHRYTDLLKFNPEEVNTLHDEFVEYQLMEKTDIPPAVWKAARDREETDDNGEEKEPFARMDVLWAFLSKKKSPDGCQMRFANLAKLAQLVLVLPHSNASEERLFSLVRLNKTSYRSRLSLDGTLSSILTIKMHNAEPCYKFEPTNEMLENAKRATREYNQQHLKQN